MTDASTEGLPLREGHIVVTLPSGEQYYDPPIPDRASAEGLRARIESLIDDDEAAYVSVALIRAALRDTGPHPWGQVALARAHLSAGEDAAALALLDAALRDTGPRPVDGIPPGPYTVEHETEQGGIARIWGKPWDEGGWAIPIVATGQGDIMRALAAHLNALSTPPDAGPGEP